MKTIDQLTMAGRRLFILPLVLLFAFSANGQSYLKKQHSFSGLITGAGFQTRLQNGKDHWVKQSAALGLTLDYEYNLLNHISIGASYRNISTRITDTINLEGRYQSIFFLNILHLINTDYVDLSLVLGYGPGFYQHTSENSKRIQLRSSGLNYSTGLRLTVIPERRLGFVLGVRYSNYLNTITRYRIDGRNRILAEAGKSSNLSLTGFELQVGVTLMFPPPGK